MVGTIGSTVAVPVHLSLLPDSVSAFEQSLEEPGDVHDPSRRMVKTATKAILKAARSNAGKLGATPKQLESLGWLFSREEAIFALLIEEGLRLPTISSYWSRFRRAVQNFQTGGSMRRRPAGRRPSSAMGTQSPLSPAAQVAEAFDSLERWPYLRAYLRGPLAKASKELLDKLGESPMPPPTEKPDDLRTVVSTAKGCLACSLALLKSRSAGSFHRSNSPIRSSPMTKERDSFADPMLAQAACIMVSRGDLVKLLSSGGGFSTASIQKTRSPHMAACKPKNPKSTRQFHTVYINRWGQRMDARKYGYKAWPF
jgi:hypothetical protein